MSDVHVFIDVDGVINAVHYMRPRGGFSEYVNVFAAGLQVLYSPALVERLNRLAARPNVTMHWLTTWEDDAANDLSPAIGLDGRSWDVVGHEEHYSEQIGEWWKLNAITRWCDEHKPERVVWLDDDIAGEQSARDWRDQQGDRVLAISPMSMRGLTPRDMTLVENFVAWPDMTAPATPRSDHPDTSQETTDE